MKTLPIKIDIMIPPKDNLVEKLDNTEFELQDGDCVVVSSKVVAIDEGRCIPIAEVSDKNVLVQNEADEYLPASSGGMWNLSIKNHALLLSAGIDESNANDHFILLPEDSMVSAKRFWIYFRERFSIENLAVVIADSHSIPFRYGTLGVSLGWWGFNPVTFFEKRTDLFGKPFKYTRINVADSLAGAGVFVMGETDEQTPIAVIHSPPHIEFKEGTDSTDLLIPFKEDIYYDLMRPFFEDKNQI